MDLKRLNHLQQTAHDWGIESLTSYKNGKIICSTKLVSQVCGLIEEVIKEIKRVQR